MSDRILHERKVPELLRLRCGKAVTDPETFEKRRGELKELLAFYEYGEMPPAPEHLHVDIISEDTKFHAGKACLRTLRFKLTVGGKEFCFPVREVTPKSKEPVAAFVFLNFRPDIPDKYYPSEEISDNGFSVFSFCYTDVSPDSPKTKGALDGLLGINRRCASAPGKIAVWAYAAMRVMDYIETLPYIDTDNVAVIGHSRLGKTALLAGALDERFKYIISNDSGCSGAALTRGKCGEQISDITASFPHWFCPRYKRYSGRTDALPFDQHYLLALSAPRHLMIGSAEEDLWADPESEFLSLALASEAYGLFGRSGLVCGDGIPKAPAVLGDGDALYQVRRGEHYLSREDWNIYMNFIKSKLSK